MKYIFYDRNLTTHSYLLDGAADVRALNSNRNNSNSVQSRMSEYFYIWAPILAHKVSCQIESMVAST